MKKRKEKMNEIKNVVTALLNEKEQQKSFFKTIITLQCTIYNLHEFEEIKIPSLFPCIQNQKVPLAYSAPYKQ